MHEIHGWSAFPIKNNLKCLSNGISVAISTWLSQRKFLAAHTNGVFSFCAWQMSIWARRNLLRNNDDAKHQILGRWSLATQPQQGYDVRIDNANDHCFRCFGFFLETGKIKKNYRNEKEKYLPNEMWMSTFQRRSQPARWRSVFVQILQWKCIA